MKRLKEGFTPATTHAVDGILHVKPINQVRDDVRRLTYTDTNSLGEDSLGATSPHKKEFLTIPKDQILIALRDAGIIDSQRDTTARVIPTTPYNPFHRIEVPKHQAKNNRLRRTRPAHKR